MTRALLLSLSFLSVVAVGCGEPAVTCGEDTRAEDGRCVPTRDPLTCGDFARLNAETNECVSSASCGPGTTYDAAAAACVGAEPCGAGTTLDEASRRCLPDAECGDGTRFVSATRECVPTTSCGEGTSVDDELGTCVPDDQCGPGTVQHPIRRVCVPEVRCGPGLVAHESVCLSPADVIALGTDVTEPLPDNDDPAFGGTPVAVTLEGIGESLVITGAIQRPIDRDDDGELDADVDHFTFAGTAGARLRIRVINDGLGQPAFRLTGPEDYERTSRFGVVREPNREVVLPRDGDYTLTVAPASVLSGGTPVGGPDRGYVVVIEELPWPAGTPLAPAADGAATRTLLDLIDVQDNFVILEAGEPGALLLEANANDVGTEPVALLFDDDGAFIGEVPFVEDDGRWRALDGVWVSGTFAWAVVEWRSSAGVDVQVDFGVSRVPRTDLGAVTADGDAAPGALTLTGERGAALTFDATAGQVVSVHLPGLSQPRVSVVGPSGLIERTSALFRGRVSFVATQSGAYHLLVVNRSVSDVRVHPWVRSRTPGFDGPLETGGVAAGLAGDELAHGRGLPERALALVSVGAGAVVHATADWALGMPDVELYRVADSGALVDVRRVGEDDAASLWLGFDEPGRALAVLDPGGQFPPNPAVQQWRLDVEAVAAPTTFSVEPDDETASANTLPALPALVGGEIDSADFDVWRLELPGDLGADEWLTVEVASPAEGATTDLRVLDASGEEIFDARKATTTAWRLFATDGPGPLFLELDGSGDLHDYVLSVTRDGGTTEVEPNDTSGAALTLDPTLGLPLEVHGTTERGDVDVFELLPATGEDLWVRVDNLYRSGDFDVRVYTSGTTLLIETDHEDASVLVPAWALPATIEVEGESSTWLDTYRLQVRALEAPMEAEPNDAPAGANDIALFGGAGRVWAHAQRGETDVFRVTIPTDLPQGQAATVGFRNLMERGDLLVRILDGNGADVVVHEEYAGRIVVDTSAPFFFVAVSPQGFSSNVRPALYEVDVAFAAGAAEAEPNDTAATAQPLPTTGALFGLGRHDDPDVFSIDAATLASGAGLRATTELRVFDLRVTVRDASGATLFEGLDSDVDVPLAALASEGLLTVEVLVELSGFDERGNYRLALTP